MGKFKIVLDEKNFNKSDCKCKVCKEYNKINKEWEKLEPKTRLQKRMKDVIEKIEKREKKSPL